MKKPRTSSALVLSIAVSLLHMVAVPEVTHASMFNSCLHQQVAWVESDFLHRQFALALVESFHALKTANPESSIAGHRFPTASERPLGTGTLQDTTDTSQDTASARATREMQDQFNQLHAQVLEAQSKEIGWWMQAITVLLAVLGLVFAGSGVLNYLGTRAVKRQVGDLQRQIGRAAEDAVQARDSAVKANELVQEAAEKATQAVEAATAAATRVEVARDVAQEAATQANGAAEATRQELKSAAESRASLAQTMDGADRAAGALKTGIAAAQHALKQMSMRGVE